MRQIGRAVFLVGLLFGSVTWVQATEIELKDGRVLRGKQALVAGLAAMPPGQGASEGPIVLLDDDLRRTFFSKNQVANVRPEEKRSVDEKFKIKQRALRNGSALNAVGPPIRIDPFDEFGRRTYVLRIAKGPLEVVQGITEITPQWCKVEGRTHVWDMRIATSSIPRQELQKILLKQIDPQKPEDYKKIARFCLQGERYEDARQVLTAMLEAFPDQPDLKEQLGTSLRSIAELSARQTLKELKLRSDAGQHQLVMAMLKNFVSADVPGDILQGIRTMNQEYETRDARRRGVVKQLKDLSARLKDAVLQQGVQPVLEEMADEMSLDTLDRMAPFLQNADDKEMTDAEKVSFAVSGWLVGASGATARLDTAVSMHKVRDLLRRYLGESTAAERTAAYKALRQEYAGDPAIVTAIIARMKPPLAPPEPTPDRPGYFLLQTPASSNVPSVSYHVQLPPEYDPYRRYPAIITLNGLYSSPEQQIDWWAGGWNDGRRDGQASRRGYIVIAPQWILKDQSIYGFNSRELAAVLTPLRDACRRFSIDTDRVYLSGHSMGGDAAWDIGLAHPDLWAGVIPIVAKSEAYCNHYWKNAEFVPFYVVGGDLDGRKMINNADALDRYLKGRFPTTVVEYIGRGHDDLHDEIQRIFEWMGLRTRNFFPRKFACETMRPWDNSFWWVEMQGMPPKSMVDPADWPPRAGAKAAQVTASITNKNTITVGCGSSRAVVWLSPEMIDFKQRAIVSVNGRRLNSADQIIEADLPTLLEDVRTRADRQHPFWAKLEGSTGRALGGADSRGGKE